ncbi:MAG: sulfatase [Verrucomicrobiaceae bacterium]|nr:sulfatase [Verrucomicrobiaceae bacterium]
MKRLLSFFCGLALLGSATLAATPSAKPNIIVILSDDLGWADLSCYGSRFHESPNLDKLAAEGMRFTQAYSSSPYCSPSRAAIMTGRHPARLKITDYIPGNGKSGKFLPAEMKMELPLEEVTIAEVLKKAGYATWHVGKWHLGDVGFYPQNQGFDVNIAGHAGGLPPSYFWPYGMDKKPDPNNYHSRGVPGLEDGKPGEHLCDRLTSEAIKLIEKRKPEQPFFLYLPFYDVHIPAMAKPELIKKYQAKAARMGLPNVKSAPTYDEGSVARGSDHPPKLLEQQVNVTYAAMIETMDTNVGRLMAKLRELGLDENTVVLFTSDNGGHFITSNRPLRGCKGWLYEGGVREPWFVRWPGVTKPGSVCDLPIMNTDIFPTLLEAAGLPAQPDLHRDGVSLVPLLKGGTKPLHDALFWHYPHYGNHGNGPCSSVRVGDWKLIEWLEDGSVDLFNLAIDPSEKQSVATENPQRVKELQLRLQSWRKATAANMPRPKP